MGPFATKFLLSGRDLTVVAIAEYGPFFIKLRLTEFDDPKLRQIMAGTLQDLSSLVLAATSPRFQ